MDKAQKINNHGPAEEESNQYLWLAGAFVGGFLILMIIIIIGIIVCRYVKRQNTSMYDNWATPPPLADGNIHEGVNSSILGRSMSVSHMSISPIISNEHLAEEHEMGTENKLGNFTGEDDNKKKLTINTPIVPVAPTKYTSPASENQMSSQITDNGLKDETFPPPPPLEEFPIPPQPAQDLQDQNQQSFPEGISYQQDGNGTQEPIHLQISPTDAFHNNNLDDQLTPPPPPDF